MLRPSIFAATILIGVTSVFSQKGEWKLEKSANNVIVHTRKIEGSGFKEFRGVTIVESTLSGAVALLNDAEGYIDWGNECKAAELVKRESDSVFFGYSETNAPWPVNNRDVVLKFTTSQDSATKIVTMKMVAKPSMTPEKKGIVRIKKLDGVWRFVPKKDGKILVQYQAHVEPGGGIPDWLANSRVVDEPFNTLSNLRNTIGKKEYQDVTYDFIVEKED